MSKKKDVKKKGEIFIPAQDYVEVKRINKDLYFAKTEEQELHFYTSSGKVSTEEGIIHFECDRNSQEEVIMIQTRDRWWHFVKMNYDSNSFAKRTVFRCDKYEFSECGSYICGYDNTDVAVYSVQKEKIIFASSAVNRVCFYKKGFEVVDSKGNAGFYDYFGRAILPCKYYEIIILDGFIETWLKNDNSYKKVLLSDEGEKIFEDYYELQKIKVNTSSGEVELFKFNCSPSEWAYTTLDGQVVLPFMEYRYNSEFDEEGRIVLHYEAEDVLCELKQDENVQLVALRRAKIIQRTQNNIYRIVNEFGKVGACDNNGEIIIPIEYKDVYWVWTNSKKKYNYERDVFLVAKKSFGRKVKYGKLNT